jgi:hypothetical protein
MISVSSGTLFIIASISIIIGFVAGGPIDSASRGSQ